MIIVERILEPDGSVALWSVDSTAQDASTGRRLLGHEQPVRAPASRLGAPHAICWSHGRTLGHVEIFNPDVLAALSGKRGEDEIIGCDLVEAGKMRNGARRWWCRTHQAHWGTRADVMAAHTTGNLRCSNHDHPMSYVMNPKEVRLDRHAEVGIWCSMPPAITSAGAPRRRRPKIHLHVRDEVAGKKVFDGDVAALKVLYGASGDLFAATDLTTVDITAPAAFEFVTALEAGRRMGHVACGNCGASHLDLGEFGQIAHVKHLCGSCGRDGIRTADPMISTPLKPLYDQFSCEPAFVNVERTLNIDHYPDAQFAIWASTPAVLWTSRRPQERGIHVHLSINGKREFDDTYGSVVYRGKELRREDLLATMVSATLV